MKNQQTYPQLCQSAFKLLSEGLNNKQMIESEPSIKLYRLRDLLEPSWELVIEQMEGIAGSHLGTLIKKIYDQAKYHFFGFLISNKRFFFKGINCNPYGAKITNKFIEICKYFQEEGTLEYYKKEEISKLLKAIYQTYRKEYDITEQNLPKIEYFTSEEISKKSSPQGWMGESMQEESPILRASPTPHVEEVEEKKLDNSQLEYQAIELEMKKKEMEKIKIEQAILEQKSKMLDLEKEVYSLQKSLKKKKQIEAIDQVHLLPNQVQDMEPSPAIEPVQRKSILKKTGKAIHEQNQNLNKKPLKKIFKKQLKKQVQQQDYLKEVFTEIDEEEGNEYLGSNQEEKVDEYQIDDEEEIEYAVEKKDKIKKTGKKVFSKKQAPFLKQQIVQQKEPATKYKKPQSKEKTYKSKKSKKSLKKLSIKKNSLHKKIAPNADSEFIPTQRERSDIKKEEVQSKQRKNKFQWSKEEEDVYLKCLKKGHLLTKPMVNQILTNKFGPQSKFLSHNLKNKKVSMFKTSFQIYLKCLRDEKILSPKKIQILEDFLKKMNVRSVLASELILDFYCNEGEVTSAKIKAYVDNIRSMIKKKQQGKTKKPFLDSPRENESKIELNSEPILTNEMASSSESKSRKEEEKEMQAEVAEVVQPPYKKREMEKLLFPQEIIATGKKHMAKRTMNQNGNNTVVLEVQSQTLQNNHPVNPSIKKEQVAEEFKGKEVNSKFNNGELQTKQIEGEKIGEASEGAKIEKEGASININQNLRNIIEQHLTTLSQYKNQSQLI